MSSILDHTVIAKFHPVFVNVEQRHAATAVLTKLNNSSRYSPPVKICCRLRSPLPCRIRPTHWQQVQFYPTECRRVDLGGMPVTCSQVVGDCPYILTISYRLISSAARNLLDESATGLLWMTGGHCQLTNRPVGGVQLCFNASLRRRITCTNAQLPLMLTIRLNSRWIAQTTSKHAHIRKLDLEKRPSWTLHRRNQWRH